MVVMKIYICASVLYLLSVFTIDQGISAPGHGKEVVEGINAIGKFYIYQLMSNVQLPGSKRFDS